MSYVIPLKMNDKERERFNENVEYTATKIIIGAGYVPVIFLLGAIFQVVVQKQSVGVCVCRLFAYFSIIGFIIMVADTIDKWLSLKWNDIEGVNKSVKLRRMLRKDILRMAMMVFNFIVFGVVLINV